MKLEFIMRFPEGMPKSTSQEKGERIRYMIRGGKKVPYIQHYTKDEVESAARKFIIQLKQHRPLRPLEGPLKLYIVFYFDVKNKKFWGQYKDTRPDLDNSVKLLNDMMTRCRYWKDDSQVVDLHVIKRYAEEASIYVRLSEAKEEEK